LIINIAKDATSTCCLVGFHRIDARFQQVDARFREVNTRFDRLEKQIFEAEERMKRHFTVTVESIHDDMRMFAEAIGLNSDRLSDHETRLRRVEQRLLP